MAATIEGAAATGNLPLPVTTDTDSFLVTLDPKMTAENFLMLANATCGDRAYCKFMGWTSKAKTPAALPLQSAQISAMAFSYLRDRAKGYEKALWNCADYQRPLLNQCMKLQVFVPSANQTNGFRLENVPGGRVPPPPVTTTIKPATDGLSGVRRKPDTPAAGPTPAPDAR